MAAAAGITTSAQPPTAVVNIQPGMNVQPVVLVDQNGNFVSSGGSGTATTLASLTTGVNVSNAAAPTTGQVLTATSGTTATWQGGVNAILTTLGDTIAENSVPTAVRVSGNTTATKNFYTQTGTGSASALPVWGTIAAADIPIDSTAGDIKPVSTAAAAGASGKIPDASHVHLGFFGGVFGDGSDGSVTFDGSTTVLGLVPSSQIYTMTRDIFCTGITINNGVTVKPNGFRIFCAGTVTNNGTISSNGGNASGTNNGTAGVAAGSVTATLATNAGASGTTTNGASGTGNGSMFGTGTGNSGGTGSSGTAGGSHAQRTGTSPLRMVAAVLASSAGWNNTTQQIGGAGGGGSGGGDSTNVGGGGGGGGGCVAILAWAVNNGSGTISANGGNGGSPGTTTGGCGGGGGGGGGVILIYTLAAWTAGTTTVTGGTHGNGTGSGTNGTDGTAGTVLNVVVQ